MTQPHMTPKRPSILNKRSNRDRNRQSVEYTCFSLFSYGYPRIYQVLGRGSEQIKERHAGRFLSPHSKRRWHATWIQYRFDPGHRYTRLVMTFLNIFFPDEISYNTRGLHSGKCCARMEILCRNNSSRSTQ